MPTRSGKCRTAEEDVCLCSLEGVMGVLSRKWALLIISAIANSKRLRYNELEERLDGISPSTLSERLKELEKAGLIAREAFSEIPPRVEYSLTAAGSELKDAIVPLMSWASSRDARGH